MKRRQFLAAAGLTASATTLAAPAIAQASPEIRWRLSSGFPKSLDTLYGANEVFSRYVSEVTDGRFQVQHFAAGEIVGMPQAFDAVSNGTVEMVQAPGYYYYGKDPTFAVFADIPFGLNARQKHAWMTHGGGNELTNAFLAKYNVHAIPYGNTGTQMGGWFRKEIKTVADLQGLKFRIAGLAGQVMQKLGVVPQQIPCGDVYPALERGTIDAAEFVGPFDDEKLGLAKVAKYYYSPGWWEGSAQMTAIANLKAWAELPKSYQAAFETAAAEQYMRMLARYDAKNPDALKRLVGGGTQLRWFPKEVMDAAYKATQELYDELARTNPDFAKLYASWTKFRDDQSTWYQVADHYLDTWSINANKRRKNGTT